MVNDNLAHQIAETPECEIVIDEAPVKWCTVSLSEIIERGKRLEASVYDVEAKQAREIIADAKYPLTTLGGADGMTTSYTGARFKRIWVEKSDYPIYQPSTIMDIKPSPDGYISAVTDTDIDALRVSKGQVLMTCSGTIGKVSFVSDTMDNLIFSHDLLRINCKKPSDAGYVYAYLKSKVGNKILLTNSYGAVITHIEPEHLATVPIPDAPDALKLKIGNLVIQSYTLRDESNTLIDEATKLLIEELKLPAIDNFEVDCFKKDAPVETFNVKLSEMNYRLEASYHVPIVDAIVKHFEKYAAEVTIIGDKRISNNVFLPGRFKRVYVDEGYGRVFFGGKQLFELDPTNTKYLSISKHDKRMKEELELKENLILITRSGTIGKTVLVPKHWENWVASEDVLRIAPASAEMAGYLYIYLLSDYGAKLVDRCAYGSVISHIDDTHIYNLPVPLLKNSEIQQKINYLALEANQKHYEAYKLEQKALEIMDKEVIYAK